MADLINLNRFRKEKARADKRAKGDENAARFGQTKAARELQKAREEKSTRALDAHKRDPKDPSQD